MTGVDNEPADKAHQRFWKHIKAMKRDRVDTAPLKENGLLVSYPKGKAAILNQQYQSVFTREDTSDILVPPKSPTLPMPEIIFRNGILKQLQNLKENKASGPDLIPPRMLKAAANSYFLLP